MKIVVVGCGKVGFSHLTWLKAQGHRVIGVDSDNSVCQRIQSDLGENCGMSQIVDLPHDVDAIHICVPTEPSIDGSCDLSIFEKVINDISNRDWNKYPIVVQRSTCPVGTADRLARIIPDFPYAVNPSFLRKASIDEDNRHPERIAIGGEGEAAQHLLDIYSNSDAPKFITNNRSSVELLKYVENALDSILISFWNEILIYSKRLGIMADDFIRLLENVQDRPKFRTVSRVPGRAYGMWCLPKDIQALIQEMTRLGCPVGVLSGTSNTNSAAAEIFGEGNIPAKMLYTMKDCRLSVLEEGVKQIAAYLENGH